MTPEQQFKVKSYMLDNAKWYTGCANGKIDVRLLARDARETFGAQWPSEEYQQIARIVAAANSAL